MRKIFTLLLVLFVAVLILGVGCKKQQEQQNQTIQQQNQEGQQEQQTNDQNIGPIQKSKKTKIDTPELILQLSDLPGNYSIYEKAPRVKSDVNEEAINLGWIEGYYVRYGKTGDNFDYTTIEQYISIYPIENITKVIKLPRESNENISYDELPDPKIGDESRAFKIKWYDSELDEWWTDYEIEFIKMNVYEDIYMSGTSTDYELLKELAKKAEKKIR